MNRKARAIFIAPADSQPRFHRRVSAFIAAGYSVRVYSFTRGFYRVNSFPPAAEVILLGRVRDGNYALRLPSLLRASQRIRLRERAEPTQAAAGYAFGLDSAFLLLHSMRAPARLFYEVGDLRTPSMAPVPRYALNLAERYITRRFHCLALTSPWFLSEHFGKLDPGVEQKAVILENKMDASFSQVSRPPLRARATNEPICIGVIGRLRYARTLIPLLDAVAKQKGRYRVSVHGDGPLRPAIESYAARYDAIEYRGPFRNPSELADVYRRIDVNYVVYDNSLANVRVAIPNKLFESMFFGVPLIAAEGTALADAVRSRGIGLVIDPDKPGFAEELLNLLDGPMRLQAARVIREIPRSEIVEDLHEVIQKLHRATGGPISAMPGQSQPSPIGTAGDLRSL